MKRYHNKVLEKFSDPSVYHVGILQRIWLTANKQSLWFYFRASPEHYLRVILLRIEHIELPLLDVYEVRANVKDGIVIGYAFDTNAKNISHANNFLTVCTSDFRTSKVKELSKTCFNLKHKLDNVYLYEYEGMASMVTTGLPERFKESMELN